MTLLDPTPASEADTAPTGSGTARPSGRDQSLNDVRAAIPEECYRPSGLRAAAALVMATLLYLAPLVGLVVTDTWWLTLLLWPLAGLGVAGLFVLGHDASHGALLNSRRLNRI